LIKSSFREFLRCKKELNLIKVNVNNKKLMQKNFMLTKAWFDKSFVFLLIINFLKRIAHIKKNIIISFPVKVKIIEIFQLLTTNQFLLFFFQPLQSLLFGVIELK
jgi:hypothetical protein